MLIRSVAIHNSHKVRSLASSFCVFLVSMYLAHIIVFLQHQHHMDEYVRYPMTKQVTNVAASFQVEINRISTITNGLKAYIKAYPNDYKQGITIAMEALYKVYPHLHNISIAPENRIKYTYPARGNEGLIGLDYSKNLLVSQAIKKTIETQKTVLFGPVNLGQEISQIVNFSPIFLNNGKYWGTISVAFEPQKIFRNLYENLQNGDIQYAIRNVSHAKGQSETLFGDTSLFQKNSIKIDLAIPGGQWQLAAVPMDGWCTKETSHNFSDFIALVVSFLLALIWYKLMRKHYIAVSTTLRMQTILQTTHDCVVVINSDNSIEIFNAAAEKLFGYKASEMLGKPVSTLLPLGSTKYEKWSQADSTKKEFIKGEQINVRHKDGSIVSVEITVGEAVSEGQSMYVVVARDINERLELEKKLKEFATKDCLTKALRRREFMEQSEQQFKLFRRTQQRTSVLMLDLDYFKAINDKYGHAAGDDALATCAGLFRSCLRETDLFGRYGGEEFIALLPDTSPDEAAEVAQRVCNTIKETVLHTGDHKTFSLTVSIGVSEFNQTDNVVLDSIQRADKALYKAKSNGRNQFVIYDDSITQRS